ncbi:MAG: type III-A CRISPR-associated protein Csm2 [Candidatus Helarchaeota archaeon]
MRQNLNGVNDLSTLTPEELNAIAEFQGKKFRRIKTNQIRNIFSAITKIRNDFQTCGGKLEDSIRRELIMLKPKLAYAAGRNGEVRPFQELFDSAVDAVIHSQKPEEALQNFFLLAEAVVAYHKFYGGN